MLRSSSIRFSLGEPHKPNLRSPSSKSQLWPTWVHMPTHSPAQIHSLPSDHPLAALPTGSFSFTLWLVVPAQALLTGSPQWTATVGHCCPPSSCSHPPPPNCPVVQANSHDSSESKELLRHLPGPCCPVVLANSHDSSKGGYLICSTHTLES